MCLVFFTLMLPFPGGVCPSPCAPARASLEIVDPSFLKKKCFFFGFFLLPLIGSKKQGNFLWDIQSTISSVTNKSPLSSHPQTRSLVRSPRDLMSEAVGIMMRRALAPDKISNQRAYTSSCMTLLFNHFACNSFFPFLFPPDSLWLVG